jgi:Flp pilus assembly protein TadD
LVPKVTDFGLAKQIAGDGPTLTGAILGTPSYMSPEQARGRKDVGPAADVYGLGAVLYAALAGRPPFHGPSTADTLWQVEFADPVAVRALQPGVPRDLETVALKCLAKDPARRYPSAAALADDLDRFLAGRPVLARPAGVAERAAKWVRRNRAAAAAGAAVSAALAAGTGVATWQAVRATRAEQAATDRERAEAEARAEAERQAAAATVARAEAERQAAAATAARDEARRQAAAATAVRSVLEDVLAQGSATGQAKAGRGVNPDLTVREAMEFTARTVGERFKDQPLTEAEVRQTLGNLYAKLGLFRSALPELERAAAVRRTHLGAANADTLKTLNDLGVVLKNLKRFDESEAVQVEALAGKRKLLGDADRSTLRSVNNLGMLYVERGDYARAEPLLREALAGRRRAFTDRDTDTLNSVNNMGVWHFKQRQYADAEPYFAAAADGYRELLTIQSPLTLQVVKNLAMARERLGRYAEAEPLLLEVLGGTARLQPSERRVLLADMAGELVRMYEKWGRPVDARRWRHELKAYLPREAAPPPRVVAR